jgi:hypothetical protein
LTPWRLALSTIGGRRRHGVLAERALGLYASACEIDGREERSIVDGRVAQLLGGVRLGDIGPERRSRGCRSAD